MKLLLDTHALVWFYQGDTRLSLAARAAINAVENEKLVSPASFWEIAIKMSRNQYILSGKYEDFIQEAIYDNGFTILPVEPKYTTAILTLPHHHKDPFDRLLIAQASVEAIPIISADVQFDAYPITRLW